MGNSLGYIAGALTTIAFIPQVIKIRKTNDTKELSLETLIIFCVGQIMWVTYGVVKKQPPVALFASITIILYCYMIYKKIKLDGDKLN